MPAHVEPRLNPGVHQRLTVSDPITDVAKIRRGGCSDEGTPNVAAASSQFRQDRILDLPG